MTNQPSNQKSGRLTTGEASRRLGIAPQTVRNRVQSGQLRGDKEEDPKTGRVRYYIPADEVEAELGREGGVAEMEDVMRRYVETMQEKIDTLIDTNTKILNQLQSNGESMQEMNEALQVAMDRQVKYMEKVGVDP